MFSMACSIPEGKRSWGPNSLGNAVCSGPEDCQMQSFPHCRALCIPTDPISGHHMIQTLREPGRQGRNPCPRFCSLPLQMYFLHSASWLPRFNRVKKGTVCPGWTDITLVLAFIFLRIWRANAPPPLAFLAWPHLTAVLLSSRFVVIKLDSQSSPEGHAFQFDRNAVNCNKLYTST